MIEIGSKTAEKNSAQTNRHYENNGHLAVNQKYVAEVQSGSTFNADALDFWCVNRSSRFAKNISQSAREACVEHIFPVSSGVVVDTISCLNCCRRESSGELCQLYVITVKTKTCADLHKTKTEMVQKAKLHKIYNKLFLKKHMKTQIN